MKDRSPPVPDSRCFEAGIGEHWLPKAARATAAEFRAAKSNAAAIIALLMNVQLRKNTERCMLVQLILATAMVVTTVLIHLFGLALLIRALRSHTRIFRKLTIMPLTLLLVATIGIFMIHTLEIWLYALLYVQLGTFADFEQALYFSTVTYATIGYGDLLMPHEWRILGAIEGAAGIIMLGWSTAFLVSLLSQLKLLGHDWLASD
jgi:hypothetical protein